MKHTDPLLPPNGIQPSLFDDYTLEDLRAMQMDNNRAGIVDSSLNEAIRDYQKKVDQNG